MDRPIIMNKTPLIIMDKKAFLEPLKNARYINKISIIVVTSFRYHFFINIITEINNGNNKIM